jgi:hypothetical protein
MAASVYFLVVYVFQRKFYCLPLHLAGAAVLLGGLFCLAGVLFIVASRVP